MCPQIYSPIPISIDRANLSNISKNNAYPIILLEVSVSTNQYTTPAETIHLTIGHIYDFL